MSQPQPFNYPAAALVRKHAPAGYKEYSEYKPWLRDEFEFRCVYCLQREMWSRARAGSFSVDHIVPQSTNKQLICDYNNLLYACCRCNSFRREIPVLDPTQHVMDDHLAVTPHGTVHSSTTEGQFLIELLHLNAQEAVRERMRILRILARMSLSATEGEKTDYLETFGYPEDLPDLRALRPPINNNSKSPERCFFVLREQNLLPEVY